MKTILTLAVMILIMLCHGACRSSKFSNQQQSRLAVQEQSDINSRVQEVNHYARSGSITDSSGQSFQLTIFPADTFKF